METGIKARIHANISEVISHLWIERFPFNPKFWYIKWNGPFRFCPTGIFGTSFEGGPI